MNMLMIDLETLSLKENAAIASIGLVAFNKDGIVNKKQINVSIESCQDIGLDISASTVKWWMSQSTDAIKNTFSAGNEKNIFDALRETSDFYNENMCENVFSNGAIADLVWISNAYKASTIEKPWKFWNELCFRTVKSILPRVDFSFSGTAHVAVDDAENQALYMIKAINNANIDL